MLDDIDPGALRHAADDEPGLRRTGTRRFRYVDQRTGERVKAKATLARIDELVIPPAWGRVWICVDDLGHVQATGRDVKGRKQYRYHPAYRRMRDAEKFADLVPFGEAVGPLRIAVADDLEGRGWSRERLLALVITLLDRTAVRIGNAEYARANKTFGLTTLRQDHVSVGEEVVRFCFVGKSAKEHQVELDDPALARAVRSCRQLPGQLLFQWKDPDGELHPVRSDDVNLRLRQLTGLEVTAKTFRTWSATVRAAELLSAAGPPASAAAASREVVAALDEVADDLGNTRAVARASYVHPAVTAAYEAGCLGDWWRDGPSRAAGGLHPPERRTLAVLRKARRAGLVPGAPARRRRAPAA